MGYKQTLKSIRNGTAKMVFISNNCPIIRKTQIEYYAMLARIEIITYGGNNVDLGTVGIQEGLDLPLNGNWAL